MNLFAAEPPAPFQSNRVQPELGLAVITLDMYVRRFAPVAGIEKKAEWSYSQDSRHVFMLRQAMREGNVPISKKLLAERPT